MANLLTVATQRTWKFRSKSNPKKSYTVVLWTQELDDKHYRQFKEGMLTCDCPAFRFQKKPMAERECKHTKEVTAILLEEAKK